jgi:hypothetical protein
MDNTVEELLNKITPETIIDYAKLHNFIITDFVASQGGPCLVMLDGTIVNCSSKYMHSKFVYKMVLSSLSSDEQKYYKNNPSEASYLEDQALDYLEQTLGIITVNGGEVWDNRCKIVISLKPTAQQYDMLLKFLDYASTDLNQDDASVFCGDTEMQDYLFDDYTPDEILKKIKKYFAFGRLEEKLKHKTYIVEGTWSLPWSSFNMKTMKKEQAPQSKINANIAILKGIFDEPITPLDAEKRIDAIYGDDDLFDDLDSAYINRPKDYDARIIVYHHLKDMVANYKENSKNFTVPADEKTTDAVIESINKILDDYFNSL